ncbi:hypothetical protein [Streptomyces sp. NPDC050428]
MESTTPYIRLAETCLRALAEPLGVVHVTIDPQLGASSVWPASAVSAPGEVRSRVRRRLRALPVALI